MDNDWNGHIQGTALHGVHRNMVGKRGQIFKLSRMIPKAILHR
jgi:tetrahydromethanopterin S-methyltransferase subunit A